MNDHGPGGSAIFRGLRWLRLRWLAFVLLSAAMLVPCFWHAHVQAADLGSHLYTAWLTQSVGVLPGLRIERQYTNVLIDILLSHLMPYMGAVATERAVVSFCVLMFFWGAFAFASAAAGRAAWQVIPLLAMFVYGAIFHLGFFNFYLSVAFSLLGLALVVGGNGWDFLLLPVFFALAALAHPMGAACMVALGIYLAALRRLAPRYQWVVTVVLLALAFLIRSYLVRRFEVLPREIDEYWLLGADQLLVFSNRYLWFGVAALGLCALCIGMALRKETLWRWIQFYSAIAVVVYFAPGGLYSDKVLGMMGYLPDRGSLYSAIALVVLIACCRPRAWFVVSTGVLAAIFFVAIHHDTGLLERRQEMVTRIVHERGGPRVISMVPPIPEWRVHEDHSVDRACIGQCYSYNNYEPNTKQFRLRADAANRVVLIEDEALEAIKDGKYVVKPRDLPLTEVYECGGVYELCIAVLRAGQQNGEVRGITAHP